MSKFNESLPKGFVVVGIEEKYDDNRGAYVLAHIFTGDKVWVSVHCINHIIEGVPAFWDNLQ